MRKTPIIEIIKKERAREYTIPFFVKNGSKLKFSYGNKFSMKIKSQFYF